ncbi:MAG: hypothetical protein JWM07_494 [Candidatus Saccharibacteria bacterium]|nr:hypothetical protein [Candidatus Saccharibacteria bacterium]
MTDDSFEVVHPEARDTKPISKTDADYLRLAENWGIFATFLFLGTLVIDLGSIDQLLIWLARAVFAIGAAVAFIFASRFEKNVRAAQKVASQSDSLDYPTNGSDSETT